MGAWAGHRARMGKSVLRWDSHLPASNSRTAQLASSSGSFVRLQGFEGLGIVQVCREDAAFKYTLALSL